MRLYEHLSADRVLIAPDVEDRTALFERYARLFHAAGMSVTLRQYPGGDDLNTQMLHDIDVWLMEQVTGVSSDTSDESSSSCDQN